MKYFSSCENLDEHRAEYRRLIKINHPDVGGDAETMKAINNAYDLRLMNSSVERRTRAKRRTHTAQPWRACCTCRALL